MIQSQSFEYGPYDVSRDDKRPKFQLIIDWVTDKIKSGEWPVGHKLPSQSEWERKYRVRYGTLRGAYLFLKGSGYVVGQQGEHVSVCESELNKKSEWVPSTNVLPLPRQATIGNRTFTDPTAPEGRSLGV
jgi:DNA-binding transcriptional regulator YhcF (GntR family)